MKLGVERATKKAKADVTLAAATLAAVGGMVVFAQPAAAITCEATKSGDGRSVSATCTDIGRFDYFRAKAICVDPHGSKWTMYGPKKSSGQTSTVKCGDNVNVGVYQAGWELIETT
ncbi:hypothetical protein [Streptomyces sp. NPDC048565]|uniref:hypothetical protein n=1 Tax=Streptomyces sp. NPDC048565 TaxID=3155266 RepID=UPI00342C38A9